MQKHLYWDHIAVKPDKDGVVLLTDTEKDAVAVAGQFGKGRIVFSGMITLPSEKNPNTDPDDFVDKKFLINCVNWLGRINTTETAQKKTLTPLYSSGKQEIELTLLPDKKYAAWFTSIFTVKPGMSYLVEFSVKKPNTRRFIPFVRFFDPQKRRCEYGFMINFSYGQQHDKYKSFSGVFTTPVSGGFNKADLKFLIDWFQDTPRGSQKLFLRNISVHELGNSKEKDYGKAAPKK